MAPLPQMRGIGFDQCWRGVGGSRCTGGRYGIAAYLADTEAIGQDMGIDAWHVLGSSWGACWPSATPPVTGPGDQPGVEQFVAGREFELRRLQHFATKATARTGVAAWIEDYNTVRRHCTLGMMSRADYEQALAAGTAA